MFLRNFCKITENQKISQKPSVTKKNFFLPDIGDDSLALLKNPEDETVT